jgi:hypothetical protein
VSVVSPLGDLTAELRNARLPPRPQQATLSESVAVLLPHRGGHQAEVKGRHMARALLGYVGTSTGNEQALLLEVARLRRRVAELESQLEELRASTHVELDLELHRIAEAAEPALA